MSNSEQIIRDEKYDSTDYPQWLCEYGRYLYDSDLSFRINCQQAEHADTRRSLNKQAERLANAE
jgi:hypothetical protein